MFTDGPFVETKEHLGGFAVVDVPDDVDPRYWAGRIAVAVGRPQEVHRFPHRLGTSGATEASADCLEGTQVGERCLRGLPETARLTPFAA